MSKTITEEKLKELKARADEAGRAYREKSWEFERQTLAPKMRALVGAIFKHKNKYSFDEEWDLFYKIESVQGTFFRYSSIEKDAHGEWRFRKNIVKGLYESHVISGEKVGKSEWDQAIKRMIKEATKK